MCEIFFLAGPPVPAALKHPAPHPSSSAQADSDDEIGPPLPPEMRGIKKATQSKARDSDEESSEDEDDVRISIQYTLLTQSLSLQIKLL